jgi:hypothetical protein
MTKRARMNFPQSLSSLLQNELKEPGLAACLREAEIWRLWPEVVGQTVSSRAQPLRISNGILTVVVSSSPWMQELNFLKGMMIEKLNGRLGGQVINEIILKSGKVENISSVTIDNDLPGKKRLTERQSALISEQAAMIGDSETRNSFIALMKTCLENDR